MTDENRKGRVPTPEEILVICFELANLAKESLKDAGALRDETRRLHAAIKDSSDEAMLKIDEQATELKDRYDPSAVENATDISRKVANEFKQEMDGIRTNMAKDLNAVTNRLALRGTLGTAVVIALIIGSMLMALKLVPSLDEIQARRSEVQRLSEDINSKGAELNSAVENLKSRLVFAEGHYYARLDSTPVSICLDVKRQDTCGTYVLVR
jgi:hypothetical protein